MAKILVTGGPVHAYLDAVKIITNKFKGGLMNRLAGDLSTPGNHVILLHSCHHKQDALCAGGPLEYVAHDGFTDYREKVLRLAPTMDAVVLGAAVANLIPKEPLQGKFPSYNYKVGDTIPINFTIAPRVVDEVKGVMRHNAHLFAFKLLSGVAHDELISAAYDISLHSKSNTVFANDAKDLQTIYAVTKERGEHKMSRDGLAPWITEALNDRYYHTKPCQKPEQLQLFPAMKAFDKLHDKYWTKFQPVENGMVFGTIAIRDRQSPAFFCTARGKKDMGAMLVYVVGVNHEDLVVRGGDADNKPSLNAPLLHNIFYRNPDVKAIVHFHEQIVGVSTLPYAPPGTQRDSKRDVHDDFNIEGHGCFLMIRD
jgi:hypothetical protein